MAATGKTPILLYGSTTATNTPVAGNLTNSSDGCEIAINVADKNLFFKDSTNTVNTVPIRQSSASSNGWLSSTDWSTFNSKQAALVSGTNIKTVSGTTLLGSGDLGTIGTGYGGTGLTSFNSYGVMYASSSSVLATDTTFTYVPATGTVGSSLFTATTGAPAFNTTNQGTGPARCQFVNTGGTAYIGLDSSVGGLTVPYALNLYHTGAYPIALSTNGTQKLTVAGNTSDVTVNAGNLVIGTSGKGIDFSATAGTGTSELLADYEEGTWTPVITGSSSNPTVTYDAQRGLYTKVGRLVTIECSVSWSAFSGGSGDLRVSGLPFAFESAVSVYGGGPIGYQSGLTFPASRTFANMQGVPATTYVRVASSGSAVATSMLQISAAASAGDIIFTYSYSV